MPSPDLSVIVVTHGGKELALATLRSARACAPRIEVEWLVVDSGSTDGTPDAIEDEFPDVGVIRGPNVGFAAANNLALSRVRGRYVLLLNPDVEVLSGTLDDLVSALDARPTVGAASVVQRGSDGRLQHSIRRYPSPTRQLAEALLATRIPGLHRLGEVEVRTARYATEGSAQWLVGAFLVVRAEAASAVGPLDERFFLYSEETDWCYRIRAAGWQIRHLPVMEVTHHAGGYPRAELAAQLTYSKLLFASKHFAPARREALRVALVAGHAIRAAAFGSMGVRRHGRHERSRAERLAMRAALGAYRPDLGNRPDARRVTASQPRRP